MDNLEELLKKIQASSDGKRRKGYFYCSSGHAVYIYNEPVSHYSKFIDSTLTLFIAEDYERVIGMRISLPSKFKMPENFDCDEILPE